MADLKKLTILHSNDLHGDFLDEEINGELVGGLSLLSGYVNRVRNEEKNTIYCIAGDMFRGSVIDSEYRGVSTIEIMNMLAPDVVTIGNHEADYGIAHLLFIEKCAKFPIINANLHIKTNGARLFKPYHIMEIDGMKILFIGIITEAVLSQTKSESIIGSFIDIHEASQEVGRICNSYKTEDIDLTVLLTHIGYEEDKKLAASLDPAWGVDVIVGGHSHTTIAEPAKVNDILIVQAGTGTDEIGRFDLVVDKDTNSVHSYTWQSVPINNTTCTKDSAIEDIITFYKSQTDKKYSRLVSRFKRQLTHPSRYCETEMGNLFADIFANCLDIDIMLLGSGSIRNTEMGPIVLYSDLCECFPYDDPITRINVTGAQLKQMIRFMLRDEVWEGSHSEFYQFSNALRVTYHRESHAFVEFLYNGREIEEGRIYRVGLQYFHFKNIEDFFSVSYQDIVKNGDPKVLATSCRDVVDEYLSNNQCLDSCVCGRLTLV